jgi:hypothetical protein
MDGTPLDRTVDPSCPITVIRRKLFRPKSRRDFIQFEPLAAVWAGSPNSANGIFPKRQINRQDAKD